MARPISATPKAIGIDLGTTFSRVAVFEYGNAKILEDEEGIKSIPSCVSFNDIERVVGTSAKRQATMNPLNTVFGIKRCMGRKWKEECLQSDTKVWPFTVECDARRYPNIKVQYHGKEKSFEPEEISAMILEYMMGIARHYLGQNVTDAVITVPAYFNQFHRQATMDAARIAGLKVLRLISNPTAAAIAYATEKRISAQRKMLVFDFGGGCLDVSIIIVGNGHFDVKAVAGDTHLGGEDFTDGLLKYCIADIKQKHRVEILADKKALARLRTACETAKLTLTQLPEARISVDSLKPNFDYEAKVTREMFEKMNKPLLDKVLKIVQEALSSANIIDRKDIDDVLLVGGSTRIPCVQSIMLTFFSANQLRKGINADEAGALGAAIQAAILINHTSDIIRHIQISDITAKQLCIHTKGGMMSLLIKNNSKIPKEKEQTFFTRRDNDQEAYFIKISEVKPAKKHVGRYAITGFDESPKDCVQLNIWVKIDENGILNLSADQVEPRIKKNLPITNGYVKLSDKQVAAMRKEAESSKKLDNTRRESFLSKTKLTEYIDSTEISFQAHSKDKYINQNRNMVLTECGKITQWLKTNEHALKEEYENKLSRLQGICEPHLENAMRDSNRDSLSSGGSAGESRSLQQPYKTSPVGVNRGKGRKGTQPY